MKSEGNGKRKASRTNSAALTNFASYEQNLSYRLFLSGTQDVAFCRRRSSMFERRSLIVCNMQCHHPPPHGERTFKERGPIRRVNKLHMLYKYTTRVADV